MSQRKGCKAWNKGLKTPEHVKKKLSTALTGKPGHIPSEEAKQRISQSIRSKVKAGEWHNSFSRSRIHEYKGVRLYGMWFYRV